MDFGLALMALLVIGYALVAKRLARYSISSALAFVAIGVLLSEDFLGILVLEPETENVKLLAELTLALVLFSDASSVDLHALRQMVQRSQLVGVHHELFVGRHKAALQPAAGMQHEVDARQQTHVEAVGGFVGGLRIGQLRSAERPGRAVGHAQPTRELTCDCTKARREVGLGVVPRGDRVREGVKWLAAEGLVAGAGSARR